MPIGKSIGRRGALSLAGAAAVSRQARAVDPGCGDCGAHAALLRMRLCRVKNALVGEVHRARKAARLFAPGARHIGKNRHRRIDFDLVWQKQAISPELGALLRGWSHEIDDLLRSTAGANEYNLAESKVAIGDGGVTGKGIGNGTQTNLGYVPEQRTDFIFTAVGEQVGLIGSGLLLLLFAVVMWRIWRAASLARDLVGTLICVGVLAMLVFQVFENVGMTMGIMPVAGIPLPLMSYGGSAVIATFAGIGLVLNVRMRRYA